jgi:hypothetical protein
MSVSDLDYKNKYLNYKNKYLNLQSQMNGGASLNTSKKQSLIQKHKQESDNLAQKHKNELKIQAQEKKQTKNFIIKNNHVDLLWEISMYTLKLMAKELMKKQKQEVIDLARKHARQLQAVKH